MPRFQIYSIAIILGFLSCIDEEIRLLPFVSIQTLRISHESFNSFEITATLEGLDEDKIEEGGFVYSQLNEMPSIEDSDTVLSVRQFAFVKGRRSFTSSIHGLDVPPHQYWVRAFIRYRGEYVYSDTATVQFNDGWVPFQAGSEKPLREIISAVIGDEIYFGIGCDVDACDDFSSCLSLWKFPRDGSSRPKELDPFPDSFRRFGVSFVLSGSLYYGLGCSNSRYPIDFWKFTPDGDSGSWVPMENFPGSGREGASVFVIGNVAYVGLGRNEQGSLSDFYSFTNDSWSPNLNEGIANEKEFGRFRAISFSQNGRGYFMFGRRTGETVNDMWEFDPEPLQAGQYWRPLGNVPRLPWRDGAAVFQINSRVFIGLGRFNSLYYNDLWEFKMNAIPNFIRKSSLPVIGRAWSGFSSTDSEGYLINGMGRNQSGDIVVFSEIWKYIPDE